MKVPRSIRQLFDAQHDLNTRLKVEVDRRVVALKEARWHYESRVKMLQSFALKVETGRFADPSALEDFFACTLVVANTLEIDRAESLIGERFAVRTRRPGRADWTHKRPESFPFDDLRLYVILGQDSALPESDLANILFEVQIKTFLQHAWSIATHDLVYKSDGANWSKERIAYQIKAMLEHAELSIQEADRLSESAALAKEDTATLDVRNAIALLREFWEADDLPTDVRRLAQNVTELMRIMGLKERRLREVLNLESERRGGALPLNLSPHAIIVQALLQHERARMMTLLTEASRGKVLIPAEIDFPADIRRETCRNAIFVGQVEP